jgi:hypothetical protein
VQNKNPTRVFLSYVSQDPDLSLAREIRTKIKAAGYHCFMAAESLRLGDNWSQLIELELRQCDYFLLLLSASSAASDMVVEEVHQAKKLYDTRGDKCPRILPVRVCSPPDSAIGYKLAGYLGPFQYVDWHSSADSERVFGEILERISGGVGATTQPADPLVAPVSPRSATTIGLTVSLQQACVRVLKQCREFRDTHTLEPLFGIYPLSRYVNALPLDPQSQVHLIEVVIHNLVSFPATHGEPLLELLSVLRAKRDPSAADWKELDELWKQVSFHLQISK